MILCTLAHHLLCKQPQAYVYVYNLLVLPFLDWKVRLRGKNSRHNIHTLPLRGAAGGDSKLGCLSCKAGTSHVCVCVCVCR